MKVFYMAFFCCVHKGHQFLNFPSSSSHILLVLAFGSARHWFFMGLPGSSHCGAS